MLTINNIGIVFSCLLRLTMPYASPCNHCTGVRPATTRAISLRRYCLIVSAVWGMAAPSRQAV